MSMPRKISLCFFSLYIVINGWLSFAQEGHDLKTFIDEALQNNPEILVSKRQYEAAAARIPQAASLSDPVLEFEHDRITADRKLMGEPMDTWAVSQEIPFPTKLFLRAKIAAKLSRMAYENYRTKERQVIAEVKANYSKLFLIYRAMEINLENKMILEQFSQVATTRYSADKGTQADALKAQVELARVENALVLLEQERLTTQARLNILVNKDPKIEIRPPLPEKAIKFTRPLDNFYEMAKVNNPELKAYQYGIEKGSAALGLAANEFLPDFMVRYKRMARKGELEDGAWAGMLGVTVPLWFFQKQAFGVKEMKAELEMLRAEYKMKENMVLFDIRDAYARTEANKKLVELYETSFIPQAEQTVNAALKGYESEKTDFLNLLDSQRMLIDFKLERHKAIAELRIALADLERAVGVDVSFE